jgi:hypothetical protein
MPGQSNEQRPIHERTLGSVLYETLQNNLNTVIIWNKCSAHELGSIRAYCSVVWYGLEGASLPSLESTMYPADEAFSRTY